MPERIKSGFRRKKQHRARKRALQQRGTSEARLLAESSEQVFFYRHDLEHRFQHLSPSVLGVLGYEPRELVGLRYNQILTGDPSNELVDAITDTSLRTGKRSAAYQARVRHKDGHTVELELVEMPIVVRGRVVGMQGCARDVSEHKRAEAALRKSESHLRAVLDTEPECVKRVAADGTLLDMNPAGLAMIEAESAAEVIGKCVYGLILPEHREAFRQLTERVCQGESGALEFEICGLKGTRRWLETRAVPLRRDAGGTFELLGVTRDITERKRAEVALKESEERFRSAFENAVIGKALANPAGRFVRVNRAFSEIIGYGEQELLDRDFQSITHPDDLAQDLVLIRQMLDGSTSFYQREERYIHKQGHVVWVQVSISLVRDSAGRPLEFIGQIQDITERKRREESERKLIHAVEQSDEIVFMTALEGSITYVNPAFERIYGWTKEEALGKTPRILKSGTRSKAEYEQFWSSLLAGKSIRAEFENRTKDGRMITVRAMVSPVFDSQGKMMSFIAVQEDITAQKSAQEALLQSETRYRKLLEDSTLGIFRATVDGKFLDVNPALVEILGYSSRQELLSANLATDIYAKPEERQHLIQLCLESQMNRSSEVEWRRKDGKSVFVRLTGRAQRSASGEIEYFEDFVENVTERLAFERQFYAAQKFEAIGHLAGGIAHDFNNVLGAIMGWAELCQDSAAENPRLQKGLRVIIEQANHAVGLTRQLLAFARRQHMEPRVINLNNSVQEVCSLLGSVIGRDIELKTQLAPNLCPTLADPTHVEQVLMNLCVNARDAMPHGGQLNIETKNADVDESYCRHHPYALPGQYVQLSVSDTGVGMDAAILDHIFEPFFTTKGQGKGTGLGLATVYGIAKQHGGFIHAYSEVGQGTTFHVYFPVSQGAPEPEGKESPSPLRGGSETILLAEDNENLAELSRAALEAMGYSVLHARDGEEAVALFGLHRDRIALLVCDVVMPKLNGPDAYAKMRAIRDDVRVLFISGHSFDFHSLRSFVESGAELLQKPFSKKALLVKVRDILDRLSPPTEN
ncbi:MAG: PAS domain S-box protein [Acidobacteria bacterium]|nr:PAS domain S-box protein [Acidobacteriota bacterium]MCL5287564.1 PAS domain S-box protein [Acidobacteriota bacterium]